MTEALETLACVEAASGDVGRALRWLGAADASREALGSARHSWTTAAINEALAPALVTLGPDAAQAAGEGAARWHSSRRSPTRCAREVPPPGDTPHAR
jgi:hypothetical protein